MNQMNQINEGFAVQSLDIPSIIRSVARKLVLVLLISVIAGKLAYIVRLQSYVPEYRVDVTFVVTTKGKVSTASANTIIAGKMASVFAEIIASSNLAELVAKDMGTETMQGTVSSSAVPETNLLTMSVTAGMPVQIAN